MGKSSNVILILLMAASCGVKDQSADEKNRKEEATAQILALHNLQKKYHVEKQAGEFVDQFSENYVSVNRGKVSSPTKEESEKMFGNYFQSVEFEKWDDISEPVIRFSDDYSMAYTIVEKEVVTRYEAEGEMKRESTKFSWVAIYKKYDTGWKIDCVVSTNEPGRILEN